MGGQAGARGYLIQSLICVLDGIDEDHDWNSVTIEPNVDSEKVDILWTYPDRRKVVQVKSSQNSISLPDANKWAKELEKSVAASEYELRLIGPCSESVAKCAQLGKVIVPIPEVLKIPALIAQAAHKLDCYLSAQQPQIPLQPKTLEMVVNAISHHLGALSTEGKEFSRENLKKLLFTWLEEIPRYSATDQSQDNLLAKMMSVQKLTEQIDLFLMERREEEAAPLGVYLEEILWTINDKYSWALDGWIALLQLEKQKIISDNLLGNDVDLDRFRSLLEKAETSSIELSEIQRSILTVFKSLETELDEGADAAIRKFGGASDPVRTREVLAILIRANRFAEAADIIREKKPDRKWIDRAAYVFAVQGEISQAQSCIKHGNESGDETVARRARVFYAQGIVDSWHETLKGDSIFAKVLWEKKDVEIAVSTLELLNPLLSSVRLSRTINGHLELSAVQIAIYCAHIAAKRANIDELSNLLFNQSPIPLICAELCIRHLIPCPDSLPTRLRLENNGTFNSLYLAAIIERELLNKPDKAFDALVKLSEAAIENEEIESVCVGIFETCGLCVADKTDEAIAAISAVQSRDTHFVKFLNIYKLVRKGDLSEARVELDKNRDEEDGLWWQTEAQLSEKEGKEQTAQEAWEKASQLLPHPEIIRRSIQASIDQKKYRSVIRAFNELEERSPLSEKDLTALVWALLRTGEHEEAIPHLQKLIEIVPDKDEFPLQLAFCFTRTGDIKKAIEVLEPVCAKDEPRLEAIMYMANLLQLDGRPIESFDLLATVAADHWDQPEFLFAYMKMAYAAEKDREANLTFERLNELQADGKVPSSLMQPVTLEQLIEIQKESQSRREMLQKNVVSGRLPWLFVENVIGNAPTWAWKLHTQKLKWLSEEPLTRAAFSIYASNYFTIGKDNYLEPIIACEKTDGVIIDISAIVTLHELECLQDVADYYGKLVLPESYRELRTFFADSFSDHQPSRVTELNLISKAISDQKIQTVSAPSDLPVLNEYTKNGDRENYRIEDLLLALRSTHKLSPEEAEFMEQVAHKPAMASKENPLTLKQKLIIDLSTLRALAGKQVFNTVLDEFQIVLLDEQKDRVSSELQAHEIMKKAKQSHESICSTLIELHQNGKVQWIKNAGDSEGDNKNDSVNNSPEENSLFMDAVLLSNSEGIPIIADDRVLQVVAFEANQNGEKIAFSSNHFICKMEQEGIYSEEDGAEKILTMLNWRYRFIIPPARFLKMWALESKHNLPGKALIEVAAYMHDCLRDPGLLCGFEQSNPPMPMSVKFVTAWVMTVAEFLMSVWEDESFQDAEAESLTTWVAEELIPSCPRGYWNDQIGINLSRYSAKSTILMAVSYFAFIKDWERANRGLRTLSAALGLTEEQYSEYVVGALNING